VPDLPSAIELALRVLTAFNEHLEPEPADLEQLRRLAPEWAHRPADLLASEVILRAIRRASGRPRQRDESVSAVP